MKYDFRKIAKQHLDQIWKQAEEITLGYEGDEQWGHVTTEQRFANLISDKTLLVVALFELCDVLKQLKGDKYGS